MVHPTYVAEQAMKNFIMQWLNGLQPSLHLVTRSDGTIKVKSEVDSFPDISVQIKTTEAASTSSNRCRRSGYFARLRRRRARRTRGTTQIHDRNTGAPILYQLPAPSHDTVSPNVDKIMDDPILSFQDKTCPTELTVKKLAPIDIAPEIPPRPNLSIVSQPSISIPPRTVYHPTIINAYYAILGKHPSSLSPTEAEQFCQYKEFKARNDDPIEENVVYLPIGGIRTCIHCENPT